MKNKPSSKPSGPSPLRYAGLGVQLVIYVTIFVLVGYKLDQWVETERPWFIFSCSILGVIFAMVYMIRTLIRKPPKLPPRD